MRSLSLNKACDAHFAVCFILSISTVMLIVFCGNAQLDQDGVPWVQYTPYSLADNCIMRSVALEHGIGTVTKRRFLNSA